jgi:Flp pilus assembly protein protease CpaA
VIEDYVVAGALTLYLALVTALDFKVQRIPNWLTLPPMIAGLLWRAAHLDFRWAPFWAGCLALWLLNGMGGGDVKLLMALFGLFPRIELFYLLVLFTVACVAPVLFVRYARVHGLAVWLRRMLYRFARLRLFPSRAEMQMSAEPFTFIIALAGIAYVWVFWMR